MNETLTREQIEVGERQKALEEAEEMVMATLGELEYLAGDGDIYEVPRKWIAERFRALPAAPASPVERKTDA